MSENECERIQSIKYGIIAQIFYAGANWNNRCIKAIDKDGNVPEKLHDELQTYLCNALDFYTDVVDQVWADDCDCDDDDDEPFVCDECQKKLDTDFKKEFQDKKDTK